MPRTLRSAPGGMVFHVLNRAVGRMRLFESDADYLAFDRVLEETLAVRAMRLCAYCVMPNHWHFVLWPEADDDLAAFMQRLTITHVRRWKEHRGQVGYGPLYQGRYKSFPIETDGHFHRVVRYVERNALRAKLVRSADEWRWGSLWRRHHGDATQQAVLSEWPVPRPRGCAALVDTPQTDAEQEPLRRAVNRSRPYGGESWIQSTASTIGLESTLSARCSHRLDPRCPCPSTTNG